MICFPFSLMVIDQLNIKDVIPIKAEYHAPVGPHRHGPESSQIALELVKAIPGNIQSLRRGGRIENCKDSFDSFQEVGPNPARVTPLIEAFQATMLETSDHRSTL